MRTLIVPLIFTATVLGVAWFGTRKDRRQHRAERAREASREYRWGLYQGQGSNN